MKTIAWNSSFAYGIGLITTDGCLSPDSRHIEFTSKDLESVINIRRCFRLKNKIGLKKRGIYPNKSYYRVQFGDVKLYNFMVEIGLTPRKSHKLGIVKIPGKYFADFLRGVIDGDGSIGYFMHPQSKEKQFRIRIISASLDFLEWLQTEINKHLQLKGSVKQASRAYQLCYYKKASKKLADFIYYQRDIKYH